MKFLLRLIGFVVLILFVFLLGYGIKFGVRVVIGLHEEQTNPTFYNVSDLDAQSGKPGAIARVQQLYSTPDGMSGWRVIYHSTDKDGNPIFASGLIVAPEVIKANRRLSIVAWGHPTTGVAERCAPSVGFDPFDSIEGLRSLVAAGYMVVAPDYSGMGVSGPPSFLIGESEARTMLDIARAAQELPYISVSKDLAFWGHSQGGHAALFSSQIASTYANEFNIRGVAIAAPATDLGSLIQEDIDTTGGVTIGSYAFNEYHEAYGADASNILTPRAQQVMTQTVSLCLLGQNSQLHTLTKPLVGNFLTSDPTTTEPWAGLLHKNTPTGPPPSTPLFVAQGEKDTLVKPAVTDAFVVAQEARGVQVTFKKNPNVGHGLVALEAMPDVIKWLNEQFAN